MWWLLVLPIIGGAGDASDPAVVEVVIAGGQCSGVVVAPRVVVTAAHCAKPGPGGTVGAAQIVETWLDRYDDGQVDHDLAALRLDRDLGIAPLALGAPVLGAPVRLVGFGEDAAGVRGVRRQVAATVSAVEPRSLAAGTAGATTCTGDSGGAAIDASGALVGIVSAGDATCTSASQLVRPDAEPQLAEVIAAWSGACPADGTCTAGCADPDCDPCAFEGHCATGCAAVDLDCPLAGGPGDTCTSATDCESRRCLAAPEQAALAFCSAGCAADADCPAPLATCADHACVYAGTTPGLAGAACTEDRACRSGLCDLAAGVCTVPCDGDRCPEALACAPVRDTRACTRDGGCSAGGEPPLAVLLLFVRRRRRRGLQSRRA